MPRLFTLSEAEASLGEIAGLVREAVSANGELRKVREELQELLHRISMLGGSRVDREDVARRRAAMETGEANLRELVERIQESGCLLKDLDLGLIDFPSVFRGREIYLCWKLGEPEIRYWHDVEAGFQGRQAIDAEFLNEQSGGRSN